MGDAFEIINDHPVDGLPEIGLVHPGGSCHEAGHRRSIVATRQKLREHARMKVLQVANQSVAAHSVTEEGVGITSPDIAVTGRCAGEGSLRPEIEGLVANGLAPGVEIDRGHGETLVEPHGRFLWTMNDAESSCVHDGSSQRLTARRWHSILLLLETENAVARPDSTIDLERNFLAGPDLIDRLVLDLQGSDHLAEIGGAAENVDDIAQADGICEVEDGDAEPAIVMGHVTNKLAGHGSLLLVLVNQPDTTTIDAFGADFK